MVTGDPARDRWELWLRVLDHDLVAPPGALAVALAERAACGDALWTGPLATLAAEFPGFLTQPRAPLALEIRRVASAAYGIGQALHALHCRADDGGPGGEIAMWITLAAAGMDHLVDDGLLDGDAMRRYLAPGRVIEVLRGGPPIAVPGFPWVEHTLARGLALLGERMRAPGRDAELQRELCGELEHTIHAMLVAQLRSSELVIGPQHRELVFGRWNMASKVPYGTGTAALFAGPPSTGKTMAASVIASMIGRELFRIDLSRVVDKYIGETEKNLGAIFDAAVDANAILLFDEADSLFAKRTTVSSSHDRYANLETNYLLQRIEEHPGISILTTNNAQSIDPAFARRIQFRVEFPFPDARSRAEIWRRCLTPEVPRDAELDFTTLGEAFELSGANIKAAVLRAAFGAATSGKPVTTISLADAAAREFENAGKLPPAFHLPRR